MVLPSEEELERPSHCSMEELERSYREYEPMTKSGREMEVFVKTLHGTTITIDVSILLQ